MHSDTERADTIGRRRALTAPFAGVALLSVQQWLFFGSDWAEVAPWQLIAWGVLAVLVLAILLTGGLWFTPRRVRAMVDDEFTTQNRLHAIVGGFAAAMLTALVVFVVSPFEPIEAQRAAHIIISLGLGVSLVSFGLAESRSFG